MKLCSPPEFFHKNMSHEQLLFMLSTLRASSMGTKLKYSWKTHETEVRQKFSQKHVSLTFILFYFFLFMSRHEVHTMNTHTLQNAGR